MADTLEKIQKASSDLPTAASTLRRHLATLSEVLTTSRRTAEAWITDAEKLPYPDGLAEEAQRREHLERSLSHLAHMDAIAATIAEEVRALERHHNETPTELGQAANGFDTVTDENLDLLQSLGFDRWDSMEDVHVFLSHAQGIAKTQLGLSFPPDLQSGRVALGERPFGREASVLVDELYKWLSGDRAELDHLGRYRAIRADLSLGPDSQIMARYRAIKAETRNGALDAGLLVTQDGARNG